MSIRVVVVDDHELTRVGFRLLLDRQPDLEVVGEAADGAAAIEVVDATKPDVVLMDLRMPRLDGLAATRRLVVDRPAAPARVLVITSYDRDEHLYGAIAAGASGFLLKDCGAGQLLDAVRVVAAGGALLAPSAARRVLADVAARAARPPLPAPDLSELTAREREVLLLVARGRTNAEIAAQLCVAPATVKTHVASILLKLALKDRLQVVVFAYEHGLVTPGVPA